MIYKTISVDSKTVSSFSFESMETFCLVFNSEVENVDEHHDLLKIIDQFDELVESM